MKRDIYTCTGDCRFHLKVCTEATTPKQKTHTHEKRPTDMRPKHEKRPIYMEKDLHTCQGAYQSHFPVCTLALQKRPIRLKRDQSHTHLTAGRVSS